MIHRGRIVSVISVINGRRLDFRHPELDKLTDQATLWRMEKGERRRKGKGCRTTDGIMEVKSRGLLASWLPNRYSVAVCVYYCNDSNQRKE